MRPTWIIELGIFHENEAELVKNIGTENIHWITPSVFRNADINKLPHGIFYGSIQLGRQIHRKRPDILTWLGDNWYDVNKYGQLLGKHYVNRVHFAAPKYAIDQDGHKSWFWYSRGLNNWFIKSYSGYKQFTGLVVKSEQEYKTATSLCDPDHMIMFAHDQSQFLGREWRVVVDWQDGEYFPITLSEYEDGEDRPHLPIKAGPQHYLEHFVLPKLVNSYLPPMFTIDVCEYGTTDNSRYKVMEINSLLTAGWYDCCVDSIVNDVEYWYARQKVR
jgi:hypothetical protein